MKKFLILFLFITAQIFAAEPYVILVSFDGFRWDYVNRGVTPHIQKFIDDGVHALSLRPAFPSKTFPNHYSIITGLYPQNHGIISNRFGNPHSGEWFGMRTTKNNWWIGRAFWETAEYNGIITGTYFWPGSRLDDETRRPTYSKVYEHEKPYEERIDSLLNWLQFPSEKRPHFLSIYFDETDTKGHMYGPNSSEINLSIQKCDSLVNYMIIGLEKIGLIDSVNIILTSDHGMTEISKERTINIEQMLDGFDYTATGGDPFMMIQPSAKDKENIKAKLEANQKHYKFYERENVPEYYHYSKNGLISDFVLIADLGWLLVHNRDIERWDEYSSLGTHGYDNNEIDMHGIFIAKGPAFKNGYKTGTVWNVDIYPLLCEIFGIPQPQNIDGKLERIGFILAD